MQISQQRISSVLAVVSSASGAHSGGLSGEGCLLSVGGYLGSGFILAVDLSAEDILADLRDRPQRFSQQPIS